MGKTEARKENHPRSHKEGERKTEPRRPQLPPSSVLRLGPGLPGCRQELRGCSKGGRVRAGDLGWKDERLPVSRTIRPKLRGPLHSSVLQRDELISPQGITLCCPGQLGQGQTLFQLKKKNGPKNSSCSCGYECTPELSMFHC